jgi:hypothetical protein
MNIPNKMKSLPIDARTGFPIPFVVLIDSDGRAQFRVNDHKKEQQCIEGKLCHICGQRLQKEYWFVGGQLSAFHPKGVFNDGPVHKECALFALTHCPYMVNSNYKPMGEIHTAKLAKEVVEKTDVVALYNPTQSLRRLTFFCLVKAKAFDINYQTFQFNVAVFKARMPYEQVEFYLDGERIHKARAKELLSARNEESYLP